MALPEWNSTNPCWSRCLKNKWLRRKNCILLTFILIHSFAELGAGYPEINYTVVSRDPLYAQQQQDVEEWYRSGGETLPLFIFSYRPTESEDLFSVAATFNLPYETLATLNNWAAPGLFHPGKPILIPNQPGLFVAAAPKSKWEKDLAAGRDVSELPRLRINTRENEYREFFFIPGEKFSSAERISFLGSLFASPLADGKITSPYGYRPHPFTGAQSFHTGVDMRASVGTSVMAARDGVVFEVGTLEIFGHYIILNHESGFQTVYAHLQEIRVKVGEIVEAGNVIALSGNSGISTGPHLHFEIRRDGIPADPSRLTSFVK